MIDEYHSSAQSREGEYYYNTFLDYWLDSVRGSLKESSYAKYRNIISNHIKPSLGDFPLASISNSTIRSALVSNIKSRLSEKTVRDILSVVRATLRFAIDEGLMMNITVAQELPRGAAKKIRVLSSIEQAALEKYLLHNVDLCKLGVLLSLYTGIRVGELCALKWGDFNFDENTLYIDRTIQRVQCFDSESTAKTKLLVSTPKSACSTRLIPLPGFLVEYLPRYQVSDKSAYFLTGIASRTIEVRTMQNKFGKYTAESEIAAANFHALRHTFASRCVELGFDIKSLSEILGHANVNITLNRYVHPSMELKRSNMEKLKRLA